MMMASMLDHRNNTKPATSLRWVRPIDPFRHKRWSLTSVKLGLDTHDWHIARRTRCVRRRIILIGERDCAKTMQAAIVYAQTGHLRLATLHANNAYHALNRIANSSPPQNRTLLQPRPFGRAAGYYFAASGEAARWAPNPSGGAAVEARHIADLIEKGNFPEIKEAMGSSPLAPSSQTFEQDLFRLYREGTISLDEALGNADSPTNLAINNQQLSSELENQSAQPPIIDFEQS